MTTDPPAQTGASARSRVGSALWYVLPTVVGNLVPFVALPLFLRELSPAEYGAWALCYAFGLFASGLANFGMTIGLERNYFEHTDGRLRSSLLYSTLLFVAGNIVLVLLLTYLFRQRLSALVTGSAQFANLLVWTTAAVMVASLKMYFLIYLRNEKASRLYAWYTVDETLVGMVSSIVFVVFLSSGPVGLAWGPLVASSVVLMLLTRRFLARYAFALSGTMLRDNLRLSVPLAPRLLLGVVSTQIDKFLVGMLASLGAVAVYTIGQKLANIVFAYMTAIENVFAPGVYSRLFGEGDDAAASVGRYLMPFMYISVGFALCVALAAEEVLTLIAPSTYAGAQAVAAILVIHYAAMFFGKQPQLTFARKTGITSILTFVSVILNLTVTVAVVRAYGLVGAALGVLIAGLLSTTLFVAIGQRYCRIDYQWGKVAVVFGYLCVASAATAAMTAAAWPYVVRLGAKLGLLLGFVALGLVLRLIDTQMVRALFTRVAAPSQAGAGE